MQGQLRLDTVREGEVWALHKQSTGCTVRRALLKGWTQGLRDLIVPSELSKDTVLLCRHSTTEAGIRNKKNKNKNAFTDKLNDPKETTHLHECIFWNTSQVSLKRRGF